MRKVLLLTLLLFACKPKPPPVNGLGPYVLGETKLATGKRRARCQPDGKIMWCFGAPAIKVGDQPAAVDLYFDGQGDDASLIEIALRIRGCNIDAVDAALRTALGPSTQRRGRKLFWRSKFSFVAARLRVDGNACEVNFVDPKDTTRIAKLREEK